MGGIVGALKELYVRFMVWLGAEPPEGFEHLVIEEKLPTEYTLQAGDTLFSVARKFKVHYDLIAKANNIKDLDSVKPGQTLTIPRPDWKPPVEEPGEEPTEEPEPEEIVAEPAPTEEPVELEPEPEEVTPDRDTAWLDMAKPAPEVKPEPSQLPLETPLPEPTEEMVFRYEVQRGDTLNGIARKYGVTVKALVEINQLDDATHIYPGQKLIIPGYLETQPQPQPEPPLRPTPTPGERFIYTVAAGDTLNSIAKRYGITVRELIEANTIEDPTKIRAGQKLVIPGVLPSPKPVAPVQPVTYETDPNFPPIGPLDAIRAMYVSYFAAGHPQARQHIFDLLETTELNAVVVDVKSEHGLISFDTQLPVAHEIGAARPAAKDFASFLQQIKSQQVYTIARVVTFKDTPLAKNNPELAVKTEAGAIWQDSEKSGWVDPFLKAVWDYNIQIALEAAQIGFDEIQFDYVRFPTASQAGTPYFSQEVTKATRVAAVTGFLSMARGQLKPMGVKVSARSFGYTCWRKDDSVIGQDIEKMAQYLDVLSPMLYPSTFHSGIPGYKIAVAYPYEVVYNSAKQALNRVVTLGCQVRPWIQDFPDYRFDKRVYGKVEIQAQIKGCFDAGGSGYMVWDPRVQYTNGAYAPLQKKNT